MNDRDKRAINYHESNDPNFRHDSGPNQCYSRDGSDTYSDGNRYSTVGDMCFKNGDYIGNKRDM